VIFMTATSFRAFLADPASGSIKRAVTTLRTDELPPDGVLLEVHWSSVNYKDALATLPNGRVARVSPLIPGIDLAGVVVSSDDPAFPEGTEVLAHGYDLGVARHGGFAEYARVPAEWLVPLPTGIDLREAMVIGTAGFTAALSVVALEQHGISPQSGPVLVTGATGGVGSFAVSILATRGYHVVASTGKSSAERYLRQLGAAELVDRGELDKPSQRPLESATWAAAVDCVGGTTLANVLKRIHYGGAVAASGLTGGADVPTTVMPFILRGVALLGIDSVQTPVDRRRDVWRRLATDLRPAALSAIGHDIGLGELDAALTEIHAGRVTGRYVVDIRR
jgi:putative YhdH/YhfP family quinone oxidoreductase